MLLLLSGLTLATIPVMVTMYALKRSLTLASLILGVFIFEITIALCLQTLNAFHTETVYGVHIGALLVSLSFFFYARRKFGWRLQVPDIRSLDWMLVGIVIVSAVLLHGVHHDYSGQITLVESNRYVEVSHMEYTYPYFVDEWYAISFALDTIRHGSLPLYNPLLEIPDSFVNVQFPFHSFVANLLVLFGLDPLTGYTTLSLVLNVLLIVVVYSSLRETKVDRVPAGIVALLLLFITNGATLPGMWVLIPINLGALSLLLTLLFLQRGKAYEAISSVILTFLFYPPLLLFIVIALLAQAAGDPGHVRFNVRQFGLMVLLVALGTVSLADAYAVANGSWAGITSYVWGKMFYQNFLGEAVPVFSPFDVIPWVALFGVPFGLRQVYRKNRIYLLVWVVLLGMWMTYQFTMYRFGLGYERVVFLTAIFTVFLSGYGWQGIYQRLTAQMPKSAHIFFGVLVMLSLLVFVAPRYTQNERWMKLVARDEALGATYLPAAPANKYLLAEDMRVFKPHINKRFLAPAWKGTVLGVATENWPVVTKSGTIGMELDLYQRFQTAKCKKRRRIMDKYEIDLVYTTPFQCPGFRELDENTKGLVLYSYTTSTTSGDTR